MEAINMSDLIMIKTNTTTYSVVLFQQEYDTCAVHQVSWHGYAHCGPGTNNGTYYVKTYMFELEIPVPGDALTWWCETVGSGLKSNNISLSIYGKYLHEDYSGVFSIILLTVSVYPIRLLNIIPSLQIYSWYIQLN